MMTDWKTRFPLHASACEGTFEVAAAEVASGVDVVRIVFNNNLI